MLKTGLNVQSFVADTPLITATRVPALPALTPGQKLADIEGFALFATTTNYVTAVPRHSIASVVLSYHGDISSKDQVLADGDLVGFSVAVTDTAGTLRVFDVPLRRISHSAPAVAGALAGLSLAPGVAMQALDISAAFRGQNMIFGLTADSPPLPEGLTLSQAGLLSGTPVQAGTTTTLGLQAVNPGGSATISLQIVISAASSGVSVSDVNASLTGGNSLQITVTASGAVSGNRVLWVLVPASDTTPTAAQIAAAKNAQGGSPVAHGSVLWPSASNTDLAADIPAGEYKVCVAVDNGTLSNVAVSAPILTGARAPELSAAKISQSEGNMTWSVTSNRAGGAVHAALRPATQPALTGAQITGGTGSATARNTDPTPSADSSNGGLFTAPADGAYIVDIAQVDDQGLISNVVSSASVTVQSAAQTLSYLADSNTHANTQSAVSVDLSAASAGDWLLIGVTQATGSSGQNLPFDALDVAGVAASQFPQPLVTNGFRKAALFKVQCPAAAAGNASVPITASVNPDDPGGRYNVFVYRASAEPAVVQSATAAVATSLDVSLTETMAGNPVVIFAASASDSVRLSGVPEEGSAVTFANRKHACGSDGNSGGGDRALNVTTGSAHTVAIAAEIGVV